MSVLNNSAVKGFLWCGVLIALAACTMRYEPFWLGFCAWGTALIFGSLLVRGNYLTRRQPVITSATRDEVRECVVFILGPWAKTWFSGELEGEHIKLVKGRAWFLATTPGELTRHLTRLEASHPRVVTQGFFPLIPDAHVSAELICSQLAMWRNSFSTLTLRDALPCTFALYTHMSAQIHPQDPDGAFWSGAFPPADAAQRDFDDALADAQAALASRRNDSHHALRRDAIASALQRWLHDTQIAAALASLFTTLPLKLNGVLFADQSTGFTRHGAWSGWCEQTFGVLPGLATAHAPLELPEPQTRYRITTVTRSTPPGTSTGYKVLLAAFMIVAAAMITVFGRDVMRAREVHQLLQRLATMDALSSPERKSLLAILENKRSQLETCATSSHSWQPGFMRCDMLRHEIYLQTHPAAFAIPTGLLDILPMFISSSASLTSQHVTQLQALLPRLASSKTQRYLIAGYSDNTGNEAHNLALSEQRALAVRNWLVSHSTLPASRFVIYGGGTRRPVSGNLKEAERAKNRRVEVYSMQ